MIPQIYRDMAANGASYMDTRRDDWFNVVDIDILDMSHPHLCILGQTIDSRVNTYSDGHSVQVSGFAVRMEEMQEAGFSYAARDKWVVDNGFDITEESSYVDWDILTEAWVEQILVRRERAKVVV